MITRTAFQDGSRRQQVSFVSAKLLRRLVPCALLMLAVFLVAYAEAQHGGGGHGGGGGHSSGGHSSLGHAGGSHAGGHLGWLHFGFGKHSVRKTGVESSSGADASTHALPRVWNFDTPMLSVSVRRRMPSTMLWSSPRIRPGRETRAVFGSGRMRRHPGFFNRRLGGFPSSGCYFNGLTQVCFFEPLLPFCFYSGFDFFDFGFSFGGDSTDFGEVSEELPQPEMFGNAPAVDAFDDTAEPGHGSTLTNSGIRATVLAEDRNLGKDVFVLVLENGTSLAVSNYWVADGYVEYISTDGTRSHIPLEAFDLQTTLLRNAPRGLTFVLRSSPDQSR